MTSKDHFVPQMYLQRFGAQGRSGQRVEVLDPDACDERFPAKTNRIAAERGFHLAMTSSGEWDHSMEDALCVVEGGAAIAFRTLLDREGPGGDAFPDPWPSHPAIRMGVALFLASQIVRTVPQRERLAQLVADAPPGVLPRWVVPNLHLDYMRSAIVPMASILYGRAWGFGVSQECLLTSDNPAIVLNRRPEDDPALVIADWEIYLALDPHRFLYLPGSMHADQPHLLQRDHKIWWDGGLGQAFNHCVIEQAHRQVYLHPEHDPTVRMSLGQVPVMRASWRSGDSGSAVNYDELPEPYGVRLTDVVNHPLNHVQAQEPHR